ncbi:MAG: hypothetical protein ACLFP4_03380 [Spirochaetales bacterium]
MQQNRSRVIWFIAIGLAFFVFIDPFSLFERNNIPTMRVNSEIRASMVDFMNEAPTPERFVVEALQGDADIVLIGETGFVRQQLQFAANLIPELAEAGINHFGFQYARIEDQQLVDELVSARNFDEELAERILFNYMVILGYQEHVNVFRAAWQANRSRSEDEPPFRMVALGMTPDYTQINEQSDAEDPDVLARVFAQGVPDQAMAAAIREQIIEPGHKAAVYVEQEHAFAEFEQPLYAQNMEEAGFPDQKRAGNILRDEYGDRVMSALIHSPVRESRSQVGYGYPVGGVLDAIIQELPEGRKDRGFFVGESPFADAPIQSDTLTEGLDTELTFEELTDAYITLVPISQYTPVTPIENFIDDSNIARAIREFPGPNPGDISPSEMNEYIAGSAATMSRIFEQFE